MSLALPSGTSDGSGLAIAGLTIRRGGAIGLDGVDLSVPSGSLTALVGPAGSGKSTLMRVLSGFERTGRGKAAGTLRLDGQDFARLPARLRGFGVVSQPDMLFDHMTLAENVAFPLRVRGMPRAGRARLAAEALDQLQLSHAGGHLPRRASAAECQRALLARAAVASPRLLLLDEPFSEQDDDARTALLAGLRRLHDLLGTTTIVATRDTGAAVTVADRIAVLWRGRVEQQDVAQAIFDRPGNVNVARMLGELNELPGTIEALEDDIAIVRLGCGPLAEGRPMPALRPGDPCLLALRPDRIAIAPVSAEEMGGAAIQAALVDVAFQGASIRLTVLIGSGAAVVVRRPAAAGLRGLVPGRSVAVAWQPPHADVFPCRMP